MLVLKEIFLVRRPFPNVIASVPFRRRYDDEIGLSF